MKKKIKRFLEDPLFRKGSKRAYATFQNRISCHLLYGLIFSRILLFFLVFFGPRPRPKPGLAWPDLAWPGRAGLGRVPRAQIYAGPPGPGPPGPHAGSCKISILYIRRPIGPWPFQILLSLLKDSPPPPNPLPWDSEISCWSLSLSVRASRAPFQK